MHFLERRNDIVALKASCYIARTSLRIIDFELRPLLFGLSSLYSREVTFLFFGILSIVAMETGMSRNGQNGVPAYQRIQGAIRERIDAGELKPGDAVTSERELAKVHRVSLMIQPTRRQRISLGP